MAYGIVHHFQGGTDEQYKASLAAVHPGDGLPDGQIFHAAGPSEGGWTVVAVHDSKESWERFRDGILMPRMQARHRRRLPHAAAGDCIRRPQPAAVAVSRRRSTEGPPWRAFCLLGLELGRPAGRFSVAAVRMSRPEYRIEPCKTALNPVRGMPFKWSLNPYMGCAHRCTFCYVRHFEQRADRPPDDRYGRSIRVKSNVAEVLRGELARRSWAREEVALGTATDPYQPAEGRFRLTRACLGELDSSWTPFSIVTRGPLVVRDVDVLQEAGRRAGAEVCFSLPTLDERVWRTTEPGTAPPASRLEAVRRLARAGVEVGVGVAPILPGLSDAPEQLTAVVRAARAAGARTIWASVVHLRPGVREHFLEGLERDWPEEVARYEALFAARAYLPAATTTPMLEPVRRAAATTPGPRRREPRPPSPRQLTLAV